MLRLRRSKQDGMGAPKRRQQGVSFEKDIHWSEECTRLHATSRFLCSTDSTGASERLNFQSGDGPDLIGRFSTTAKLDLFDESRAQKKSAFRWYEFQFDGKRAGELLAVFELIQVNAVRRIRRIVLLRRCSFLVHNLESGRNFTGLRPRRNLSIIGELSRRHACYQVGEE